MRKKIFPPHSEVHNFSSSLFEKVSCRQNIEAFLFFKYEKIAFLFPALRNPLTFSDRIFKFDMFSIGNYANDLTLYDTDTTIDLTPDKSS